MTTRITKLARLATMLAAGMILFTGTDGAQARGGGGGGNGGGHSVEHRGSGDRDHDRRDYDRRPPLHGPGSSHNPIVNHPVHGPGSSHNPIIVVVRDHRGSGFQGVVRDHRGVSGAPGGVTVSGGGKVLPVSQPCGFRCGTGGYYHYPPSRGGFQGNVRDHRG